ncbi:MAG TPA: phospholipase [Dysgonomonas sp.]|nr:phospholipase [Dysgonomonas sp.]
MIKTQYIANGDHYKLVLKRIEQVRRHLWIGTADLKDLYFETNSAVVPFLKVLSDLIKRNVEIRLIHAKEPGNNFRRDFDKYPQLLKGLERVLCPRVHFKLIIFDLEESYIGSANLTGAGVGMKGENKRNFETGILTSDPLLVEQSISQFDDVWMGKFCKNCDRKAYCGDVISKL